MMNAPISLAIMICTNVSDINTSQTLLQELKIKLINSNYAQTLIDNMILGGLRFIRQGLGWKKIENPNLHLHTQTTSQLGFKDYTS